MRWVEQGKASALLVPRQDRLARDLLEALLIERTFREVGGGVLYASGLNGDSHTIEFARSMMHAVAQFEKRQMVSRLAEARKASGHLGGRPPFGYESKKGVLFVKEPDGEVIRWIFGKVANERRSVRQLAKMLDVEGTLDRRWSASDVHRIVKRREYKCGPPESRIVDARVWSKAQAALARRRKSFA